MKKSLGMACAASAVAVFVGWGAIAGVAGARDSWSGQQHQQTWQQQYDRFGAGYGGQDYGIPGQVGATGQQQFYGQQPYGQQFGQSQFQQPGQFARSGSEQWQPQQQYGWSTQQQAQQPSQFQHYGMNQPQFHGQPLQQHHYSWSTQQFQPFGMMYQPQFQPGIGATMPSQQWGQAGVMVPPPGVIGMQQLPTIQLELAVEQLHQSIRALAQQQPSAERDRAVEAAHRALREANQALIALAPVAPPPPTAITQFSPGSPPMFIPGPLAQMQPGFGAPQPFMGYQQFHGQTSTFQPPVQFQSGQPQFHPQFGPQGQFGQQQFGHPYGQQQSFGQPGATWQQGMSMQPGISGQFQGQASDQARIDQERFGQQ
jgi:hypothetical protein